MIKNSCKHFNIKYWQCGSDEWYESTKIDVNQKQPFGWLYPNSVKEFYVKFQASKELL